MRKKLFLICIIVILILFSTTVNADSKATAKFVTDKTEVNVGDTFTITINVSCEDGINGMSAKYSFDEEKLELVSKNIGDKFSDLSSAGEIVVIANEQTIVKEANICTFTFKVKDGTTTGINAEVKFTDIIVDSDAEENSEITIENQSISIKISEKITDKNNTINNTVDAETNNVTNEITNNKVNIETNNIKDEKNTTNTTLESNKISSSTKSNKVTDTNSISATGSFPKTGIFGTLPILGTIALILVSGVVAYKKYKLYKNI